MNIAQIRAAATALKNQWTVHLPSHTLFCPVKGKEKESKKGSKAIFLSDENREYPFGELWLPQVGDKVQVKTEDSAGVLSPEIARALKGSKKRIYCLCPVAQFEVVSGGALTNKKSGQIESFYLTDQMGNRYPLHECFGDVADFPGEQIWVEGVILDIKYSPTDYPVVRVETETAIHTCTFLELRKI